MTCSVSHWSGRLGNNIQQVANCIMFAEQRNDSFVQHLDHSIVDKFNLDFGSEKDVLERGCEKAFPWKSKKMTIRESYDIDMLKE